MQLQDRTAVTFGGGGAIGGAIAETFARDGARVILAGRTQKPLDAVAARVTAAGGRASTVIVDVTDEIALRAAVAAQSAATGGIDIAVNAVGFVHVQGVPLAELSLADFERPLHTYLRATFVFAKVMAEVMAPRRRGVLMTLSTPGSKVIYPGFLGYGTTCAAIESISRILSAELGGAGIRVVCLRPDAIPGTLDRSHVREIFAPMAERAGANLSDMLDGRAKSSTFLGRLPLLSEVAEAAAFYASDRAGSSTGVTVTLTGGSPLD